MTFRRFPGTVVLGLLASLAAHAALYRGEHAMGGAYHALLLQAAVAASLALLAAFGALALSGTGHVADGSVLGSRLTSRLPGLLPLAATTALWYMLGERIEPHHAASPLLLTLACLFAAAWLLLAFARGAVRLLAGAVFAIARPTFAARVPSWTRRLRPSPIVRRSPLLRRRFARPPPIAANARA